MSESTALILAESLKNLPAKAKAIAKSLGPLALSISARVSRQYAAHQASAKLAPAVAEAAGEYIKELDDSKVRLINEYLGADEDRRLRIEVDIDFIEKRQRQAWTVREAFERIDDSKIPEKEPPQRPEWVDRFFELASKRHEKWRADLISSAYAREIETPGGITTQALWLLGTISHEQMQAFSQLLSLMSSVNDTLVIPKQFALSDRLPNSGMRVGTLAYLIDGLGLLGDPQTTTLPLRKGALAIGYGGRTFVVKIPNDDEIRGIFFTRTGQSLSSIISRTPNELGERYFVDLMDRLRKINEQPLSEE